MPNPKTQAKLDKYREIQLSLNEPGKQIRWFDAQVAEPLDYGFLTNFYIGEPIVIPGLDPAYSAGTNEHLFQAFKARKEEDFLAILTARYEEGDEIRPGAKVGDTAPSKSKALGRSCELRPDWDLVRFDVMMGGLRLKFTLDRPEGEMLLSTGTAYLQEGTWWNDRVWGVALDDADDEGVFPGRNWLGSMLMMRRAELVAEKEHGVSHPTWAFNLSWAGFGFQPSTNLLPAE